VRQVYIDVIKYVITATSRLEIICALPRERYNPFNLPSWVPDWNCHPKTETLLKRSQTGTGLRLPLVIRDWTTGCPGYSLAKTCVNDDNLVVQGIRAGYVEILGELSVVDGLSDIQQALLDFHNWRADLIDSQGDDMRYQEAFCQMLFFDSVMPWEFDGRYPFGTRASWQDIMSRGWQATIGAIARQSLKLVSAIKLDAQLISLAADRTRGKSLKDQEEWDYSWVKRMASFMTGLRLIITSSKLMCSAPKAVKMEDLLCVLQGCAIPVVLWPKGDSYIYVGEAYIGSVTFGQAPRDLAQGTHRPELFRLK
jgi:hypothetical protein